MSRFVRFCVSQLPAGAIASLTVAALVGSACAQEPAHQALVSLAEDFTYTSARLHPMDATSLGIAGHDGELEHPSEAARAADIERLRQWQATLAKIRGRFDAATTLTDRDDALLLEATLNAALNERLVYQFDRKDYGAPGMM